jgi:NADH-quinone oxidoreductase E subunit
MSDRAATGGVEEPESFEFTPENLAKAKAEMAKYPPGRQASAVLSLLYLAQNQCGNWLPRVAMDHVAKVLEMAPIRVYECATFYTMFHLRPVGKHLLQVCTTTPCWLKGSDDVVKACERKLGIGLGETTTDGQFTLIEVECLGACVNAPILQVNDDYYEDLDARSTEALLDALARGEKPAPGSAAGRRGSMAASGPTTLTTLSYPKEAG